jgi:hypothetical protein
LFDLIRAPVLTASPQMVFAIILIAKLPEKMGNRYGYNKQSKKLKRRLRNKLLIWL